MGFANLPNQVYRKSVKRGFEFTLMVVGEFCAPLHPRCSAVRRSSAFIWRQTQGKLHSIFVCLELVAHAVRVSRRIEFHRKCHGGKREQPSARTLQKSFLFEEDNLQVRRGGIHIQGRGFSFCCVGVFTLVFFLACVSWIVCWEEVSCHSIHAPRSPSQSS